MKRGLLSVFVFALSLVGATTTYAQTWTGSEVQAGDFYLYNVGSGSFLRGGNNWGTHASVSTAAPFVRLVASGSGWQIKTGYNGGYNSASGLSLHSDGDFWMDQSPTAFTFTKTTDASFTAYNISTGSTYLAYKDGTTLVTTAENPATTNPSSDNAKWILVSREEILSRMQSATENNPLDISMLVRDASLSRNDPNAGAWTYPTIAEVGGNIVFRSGQTSHSNWGAEFWNNTFNMKQVLKDMPVGNYILSCCGFGTNGTTQIYINDVSAPFSVTDNSAKNNFEGNDMQKSLNAIAAGYFTGNTVKALVTSSGDISIGVKREVNTNADWCVVDEFRLSYYPAQKAALLDTYHKVYNDLSTIVTSDALMSVATKSSANDALSTYATINEDDISAIILATESLSNALNAVKQSISDYEVINEYLKEYDSAPGITTIVDMYNNGLLGTLDEFFKQFQSVILSTLGNADGVDISAVILNNCPTTNLDFWTGTRPNAFHDADNNVAEYWNQSGASFSQVLPQLPEGQYFLTVKAFTRPGMTATLSCSQGASVNLVTVDRDIVNNRWQADAWFNEGNGDNVLAFSVKGAPKDVTITLTADNATGDHWMVWRNFGLEYNVLKDLKYAAFGTPTFTLADGTVINDGDTKTANASQIKDGIIISFPGNDIKNVTYHSVHYQAKGKIENLKDGITYIVRSNGYFDNGYNPNYSIHFGWGLFGWGDNALEDYIAYAEAKEASDRAKRYKVTVNELAFINDDMDAVDMKVGYEANIIGMDKPGTYTPGTYTTPDTEDVTAEDNQNGQYIWNMFVEAFTAKNGRAPVVEYTDIDALLEMQRYYNGWKEHDGDGAMDGSKGNDIARPYRPLTPDEQEYIRFFLATFCEGVIVDKNQNITVPFSFNINTTADVKQDAEKIERDQKVTAWDVKGNSVTDLLFQSNIQTSIEGIEVAKDNSGAIYNLAGQRVQTARQGIYIVNGKKVVLK
jgi:hypothetical protein